MTIYSAVTGKSYNEIEKEFDGRGYGDFKLAVGEAVADSLQPIREKFAVLVKDKEYLKGCYTKGAEQAMGITRKVVGKVYKKVGFIV
jgi:tryptophanyl-tRNA synthetase